MIDWNEQAREIHAANHRWWYSRDGERLERNKGELLMLVVSEISEAMEALRTDAMDDKIPHRKGEEVELADAYIRIMDFMGAYEIELDWGVVNCRASSCSNKPESLLEICSSITEAWRTEEYDHTLSFALSLIFDYGETNELDILGAVKEKRAYNEIRKDHTYEARAAAGGKKF